ncbi:MAG: MFS transporter [Nitrospira sp.]|nr:MFS transporter [Nitrospira sp.]MCP9442179.1 MFS transporter [Nitrospira sp.]
MNALPWINRTVIGIVLATFLSDFSHEMCTAVLPLYLSTLGLGPAALGVIEGVADFLVSLSKLAGGVVGHHVERKRPWTALGYLTTTLATGAIALVGSLASLVSLRSLAWIGRGFRGPLRDSMLADAVEPSHFGRAYGLERAGDMLGAVAGPLIATLLVWSGVEFKTVILWTLIPGLLAAASIFFLAQDRPTLPHSPFDPVRPRPGWRAFPRSFWLFLGGVFLFGLGDFSRTFLVLLGARQFGESSLHAGGALSTAILLYTIHNLISALAAYPIGHRADQGNKFTILLWGYVLGVGTNLLLAVGGTSTGGLLVVVLCSGIYIAVEETIEKAAAAEMLPRELRSLGLGLLACANAVGDMVSSLYVGYLLDSHHAEAAFGLAAACGAMGVLWLLVIRARAGIRSPR